MTETASPKPRREAPLSRGYVATWIALAGLSLGAMALVATQPELVGEMTASIRLFETAADPAAEARVQAEMKSLRLALSQAQLDIARVKTELQSETEKSAALTARLSTMEQQASAKPAETATAPSEIAAVPAAPAPAPAQQAEAPAKPEMKRIAVVPTTAAATAEAGDAAKREAKPAAKATAAEHAEAAAAANKGIETGSIAAPAVFGPAVVKPAVPQKPVGLKLANSTSVDALRLTWGLIAERHGDAVKSLQPRYTTGGSTAAPSYDLIAGPVKTAAEAKRLCRILAAKGVSCSVGNFDGNAL